MDKERKSLTDFSNCVKREDIRVCIVVPSNLLYAPYYYHYEDILIKSNINFDLIMWNRENLKEKTISNIISYNNNDTTNNGNWKKIVKFFGFSWFVKKIISSRNYESIIFLGSYAGNALLLYPYLKKRYGHQYWFDIRDYTYEWFKMFRWLEKKTILCTYKTVISSMGFKEFLPEMDYLLVHNIDIRNINLSMKIKKVPSDVIRISFIGNMNYYKENIKFINLFANDTRIKLQYFGTGNERLKAYCEKSYITNVVFKGRFRSESTKDYYAQTDVINNLYGSDSIGLRTALSNKLYYSLALKLPILVCKDTYMEEISIAAGTGFVINYDDPLIKENFINWYKEFDRNADSINKMWNDICKEDKLFEKELLTYLSRFLVG